MLEYGLRFLAGVVAVSAFAALGETLRPKSFAGLFGAAPSIALATRLVTLSQKGALFAAVLGGAMTVIAGLIAARFGAVIGGLFLAFPAILPATATLIERHVREGKEQKGCRERGAARRPPRSTPPERRWEVLGWLRSAS